MPKIAIDTMGLDLGSQIVVRSIKKYIKENKDVEFHVFGKEEELQELKGLATIYNCSQVMEMEEGALDVLRKKDSSMLRAISAVKDNIADGVISAGSTGAFLTGCTLKLRLIENISRAALAVVFPTFDGKGVLLL
ncbi:MAG: phosphate acyltransferase, partial [Bacillales bacterium]|nr:phosphate acyltransferase [Bacillales bacterium]